MKNQILYEEMFKNKISCNYPFKNEVSLLKKIDIKHLDFFKDIIKKNKLKIRIRYRGPSTSSYSRNPSYMLMNNATSFALYER